MNGNQEDTPGNKYPDRAPVPDPKFTGMKMGDTPVQADPVMEVADMGLASDPWAHRSSGMKCSTCMWYVRKDPPPMKIGMEPVNIGRCRRHAPTMNGYPVVYHHDWCGDHKLDENKI